MNQASAAMHEANALCARFERIVKQRANGDRLRVEQPRTLSAVCMIEIGGVAALLHIERGAIVNCTRELALLTEWDFAVRGSCAAWRALWQPLPPPGWHDLFALAKRGEMRFEGRLHPFMAHLQYFKDLLALPRSGSERSAPQ
ncbi:MAG TPA: hypothetical protein VFB54_13700 [Burkholderiales bacterium]|nr:hypothetical protein [Burkholderiales bacterium]